MKTQSLISSLAIALLVSAGCESPDDGGLASDTEDASASSVVTGAGTSGTDATPSTNSGPATSSPDTTGDASTTSASASTGDPETGSTDPSAGSGSTGASGCRHVCAQDSDCLFQGGLDTGLRCGEAEYCAFTCDLDTDCAAAFSTNPQMPCSTNAECVVSQVCLDRGDGAGACTLIPGNAECPRGLVEVDVLDIEGNPTTACGTEASCVDFEDGTRACELNSGCQEDGCPDGLTCGDDGSCFCTADEDCTVAGDTCTDGVCSFSCDSDQECEDVPLFANFEGGTLVCEGIE